MTDLAAWLRVQLDEDERVALAASAPTWGSVPGMPPASGVRWQWVGSGDDAVLEVDPAEEFLTYDHGEPSLRSVEEFPSSTGPLPAFAVTSDGEVPTSAAAHIAAWDPARVLAEVKAKRALIAEHFRLCARIDSEFGCCHSSESIEAGECPEHESDILRLLAQPYAGRPGWLPEWAPVTL